jgi:dTDP-4-dehydrorhamnose reductase
MNTDVLVTGGNGMLASALQRELAAHGYVVSAPAKSQLDVTDEAAVHTIIRRLSPRVVIQCAAFTRVDDAESDEEQAYRVNALGTLHVAEAARVVGARFLYPSTDYVFDGTTEVPYRPHDDANPINAYGRTKLAGEINARVASDYLIVRLSWLYGPGGRNFVRTVADRIEAGRPLRVVNDQLGAPSWTLHAVQALVGLLAADARSGIYHWSNAGVASWFDLAAEIARIKGNPRLVTPCSTAEFSAPARRPARSVLDCTGTEEIVGSRPHWRSAIDAAMATSAY